MPIEQLLSRLHQIECELEQLSHEFAEVYKAYDGTEFEEQSLLASNHLDNLVLAATHEAASRIGFTRLTLTNLTQFILFRKRFKQFSDDELSLLVDEPMLNAQTMLKLKAKCMTILDKKTEIKSAWHTAFEQQSYAKIRSQFMQKSDE